MTLPSDHQERNRAIDPSCSFIVQAPAGSGKTELLVQRYLALLACVKEPEEIIAITFTKKAAAEMRSRILSALNNSKTETFQNKVENNRHHLAKNVLDKDQKEGWELLNNPNRLRILTIDAFCGHIARQMPLLSRFGSKPEITENPEVLYRQAAHEILETLESDVPWAETLANFLLHIDNDFNKAQKLLSDMLAKRDQWLPYIAEQFTLDNLRKVLENGLQEVIAESLSMTIASIPLEYANELMSLVRFAAEQSARLNSDSSSNLCSQLFIHPEPFLYFQKLKEDVEKLEEEKNRWISLANLLLTTEGHWRKKVDKRVGFISPSDAKNLQEKSLLQEMKLRMEILLQKLSSYHNLQKNLQNIRLLPPVTYSPTQWQILTSLIELLPLLVAQLHVLFQEQESVDHIEVAQNALLALGGAHLPTDLALALDYQIQHILVDEFQDTSISQFRLLEALTAGWQTDDGRTLFLVGDPMQSIYRFRKAEVGLFLQARDRGIGNIKLEPLTLNVNFRSAPSIVEWINKIFKSLMPEQVDIGSGAVPYSASHAHRSIDDTNGVFIHGLQATDYLLEAKIVTTLIKETILKNPGKKIAILVSSRTYLLEIIPLLQKQNIAFRAIEITNLSQRLAIRDLLALTRALLDPADRIAWLAILRSPWCGLTLTELHLIASGDHSITIWEKLTTCELDNFSSPAKENLYRFKAVISQSLKNRGRQPFANWIYGTWLGLGGSIALIEKSELEDVKAYFNLLEKIQDDFFDGHQLEERLVKLFANPQIQTEYQVEIMTIHKAKGLEFDIVILPGLDRLKASDSSQLMLYQERPSAFGEPHLLLAPIKASDADSDPIYNYLHHEERKREQYENIRLFYVAATRAKSQLHLTGSLMIDSETGKIMEKPAKNSLLGEIWPYISQEFLSSISNQPSFETLHETYSPVLLKRPTADWQLPCLPSGLKLEFNYEPLKELGKSNYYSWHENKLRNIGIVIHYLFQQIIKNKIHFNNETFINDNLFNIKNILLYHGLLETDLNFALEKISVAFKNIMADQKGRWILSPHLNSCSELTLTYVVENEYKQIVIDRTFIDEDGIRWIIDYKTTDYFGEDLEEFLDHEVIAHRPQLDCYAQVMHQLEPNRPIQLGLYFPLLAAWREWKFLNSYASY